MSDKAETWYRGWEILHNTDWMPIQAGCQFDAYRGGVDLDAHRRFGRTLADVTAEIDDFEDEYGSVQNERNAQ